jgi:hypothetical protein
MWVRGLMPRSYRPIRAMLACDAIHPIAYDTGAAGGRAGGAGGRSLLLLTARGPPPTPEQTGGCKAVLRLSALRQTRATGMRVPVHARAFKSADVVPYLDTAGAGTAAATGAEYG